MLTGQNIKLRALELLDVEQLYQWENTEDLWHLSNVVQPFSKEILTQYVKSVNDIYADKQLRLIIEKITAKEAIGAIDLFDFDPVNKRAGVGVLIADKQNRNLGFASEALQLLIDYSFDTLQLHQLYCNITEDNSASLNLFKKHNFKMCGQKEQWIRKGNNFIDEYTLQLFSKTNS